MGYGGWGVYLAGYPPRFGPSCGKVIPGMGKQKSKAVVIARDAQRHISRFLSDWKQADEVLEVLQADGPRLPKLAAFAVKTAFAAASYRRPMQVKEYILYQGIFGEESAYYLCPRCDVTMEREYQSYCDRCGQCLSWRRIHKAQRHHTI